MKKVLFFFPHSPVIINAGNISRVNKLLEYFSSRSFSLDFCCFNNQVLESDFSDLKKNRLLEKVFLLEKNKSKGLSYFFFNSLFNAIFKIPKRFNKVSLRNKKQFKRIVERGNYDFIVMSYSNYLCLTDLLKKDLKSKIILDTHDLMTAQFWNSKKINLGKYLEYEIKVLNDKVDLIWAISHEEKYFFSQFIKKPIDVITHALSDKGLYSEVKKENDILLVASDNLHNIKGVKWFFLEVYPLIQSQNFKITVVGKIANFIPNVKGILKLDYVEDLTDLYQSSMVSISPLLSGTGLKIKVVESLSYGIPVICTPRGIDGLSNKSINGCIVEESPESFAYQIIRILNDKEYYMYHKRNAENYFINNHSENELFKVIDSSFSNVEV